MPRVARRCAGSDADPDLIHVFNRLHRESAELTAPERDALLAEVRRYSVVCDVQVVAFAVLPRQVHLLLKLPKPGPRHLTDEEFRARFDLLIGGSPAEVQRRQAAQVAFEAGPERWREFRERVVPCAHVLQEFMKRWTQRFTVGCRGQRGRSATPLWRGRYEMTRIEDHPAAAVTLAAALEGSPLRLELCAQFGGWRWTTLGAVTHGTCAPGAVWPTLFAGWPLPLSLGASQQTRFFVDLLKGEADPPPPAVNPSENLAPRPGFAATRLPWHRVVRHRIRELSEGVAVGSKDFVADYLKKYPAVRSGHSLVVPKRLRGGDFRELFAVRTFAQGPGRTARLAAPYSAGE